MEKAGACESFAQIFERRAVDEDIFLPGNIVLEAFAPGVEDCVAFHDAVRLVVIHVAAHRDEDQQVPAVALAMAHPQRRCVSRYFCFFGENFLVAVDEVEKFAGSGLHKGSLIEIGRLRWFLRAGRMEWSHEHESYEGERRSNHSDSALEVSVAKNGEMMREVASDDESESA